jgi:hypothetical protein
VGYRETVFRELIKRVTDVLLGDSPNGSAAPVPAISGLDPATGSVNGGDSVRINGRGLTGTTGVSFGANAATNVQVNSDGQVAVVTPPGAAGAVNVVVTTPAGKATSAFTYGP